MSKPNWERIGALAKRAIQGDRVAYSEFLTQISQFLRPRFKRSLPEQNVEDTLQETLMAIHKSLHTLDVSRSVSSWVCAIAHYKVQDQLRSLYQHARLDEFNEETLPAQTLENLDIALLEKLLAQLKPQESMVLKLLKLEELSTHEVAQKLMLSPSNVKVTAFRAIHKLREIIAREDLYEDK